MTCPTVVWRSLAACRICPAFCLLVLLFSEGCGTPTSAPPTRVANEDALHAEIERGPVSVTMDVVPKEPRLSDEPVLTLTILAEDNVEVTPPPFGASLGQFIIRDFYEPVPRRAAGKQLLEQVYTLEPTQAGLLTIDPITIRFVDNRPQGDGAEHEIVTEAMRLEVSTMIDAEAPSLSDLRPAVDPVDVKDESIGSLVGLIVGGLLALALIIFLLSRLRRRRVADEPQLTPQQLARRELDELIAGKLSQTDVKAFFVELTGVVRRYIERSTGVRAPEQTTEEFLRQVNTQPLFSADDHQRLGAFLESADLVKFAGYQPDPESIKQSTHKARQFIELEARLAQPADGEQMHTAVAGSAEVAE